MVLVGFVTAQGKIIYVDPDAPGADDGTSWENAYNFLQDALAEANSNGDVNEMRVAEGTYKPDAVSTDPNGSGDRNATFQLIGGVRVYGGYAGYGHSSPDDRNVGLYRSILSGDLSGDDGPDFVNNDENSYHVVTGSGTDSTAVLDGFIIMGGNADHEHDNAPPRNFGIHFGGGLVNSYGNPTLANCTFTGNNSHHGGGVSNYSSSPAITDCVFENNAASVVATGHGYGGAMWNSDDSEPILLNCSFVGNSALVRGGAVRNNNCNPTFQKCDFSDNYSADTGGAVHNVNSSPVFEDCNFSNNEAYDQGGGIHNYLSSAVVNNCTFSGNSAGAGGGAMVNKSNSNSQLFNCTFVENSAQRGGAIMNYDGGEALIDGCEFTQNTSPFLGTEYEDGGGAINNDGANPQITNCAFRENTARRNGGGILNTHSDPMIKDCTFIENSCEAAGGGIYNVNDSAANIIGCVFMANSAQRGGGVRNYQDSSPLLDNCIFTGNWVEPRNNPEKDAFGGAIANRYSSDPVLLNCTLSRNRAIDDNLCGGMYSEDESDPTVLNCILWENYQGDAIDEPAQIAGGNPTINHSCIEGWTGSYGGIGNIDENPIFADSDAGDYRLKSQGGRYDPNTQSWVYDDVTSPCIDAGDPMSPIGPEPFPNGGIVNMGAYGGTAEAGKSYFGTTPCEIIVAGDINGDCEVNFLDFCIMALHWCEDNNP